MKQLHRVTYEIAGGKRIDFVEFWVETIPEAVAAFCDFEFQIEDLKFHYGESSILSVSRDVKLDGFLRRVGK